MTDVIPDATLTAMISAYISGKDLRALLVRTSGGETGPYYEGTPADLTHLDDIPNNSDCRPVAAVALTSESASGEALDADNITFSSVAEGDPIQVLVIYDHTGTDGTSEILAYYDEQGAKTPNGGDLTYNVNASGLLTLASG